MKTKVLFFFLVSATVFMSGCSKSKVDIQSGSGTMMYDGVAYPFDLSTAVTYSADTKYTHNVTFTNTGNGNAVFSFSVKNDNPEKIAVGNYETSLGGNCTAHFSVNETGDYLVGTMKVSASGDTYTFDFSGNTIDENTETKTVTFAYTGKIVNS